MLASMLAFGQARDQVTVEVRPPRGIAVLLLGLSGCSDWTLAALKETAPDGIREIALEPSGVDFGVLPVGAFGAETVRVISVGDEPVTVSSVRLSGSSAYQITWDGGSTALYPNEGLDIVVAYTPQSIDDRATLSVSSDAVSGLAEALLSGAGSVPAMLVDPTALSFRTEKGVPIRLPLLAQSVGTADLVVSSLAVEGAGFSAELDTPITLAPGEEFTLDVTYAPVASGEAVTGSLWFGTNIGSVGGQSIDRLGGHQHQAAGPQDLGGRRYFRLAFSEMRTLTLAGI